MRKIANIEFSEYEYQKLINDYMLNDKKYIVKYCTIYELHYSENSGLYAMEIYKKHRISKFDLPFIKRGRFIITNSKFVNDLVGFELLNV